MRGDVTGAQESTSAPADRSAGGSSAFSLRLDPALGAPCLQKLVLAREEAIHGGVVIDALDTVFSDDQFIASTVGAEAGFASLPLRSPNKDIKHRP